MELELYKWQQDIIDLMNNNVKGLYWFYNENNKIGRTEFVKYLNAKYNTHYVKEIIILLNTNPNIKSQILSNINKDTKMIIIDTNPLDDKLDYVLLKNIVDGAICQGNRTIFFDRPLVVVLGHDSPRCSITDCNLVYIED